MRRNSRRATAAFVDRRRQRPAHFSARAYTRTINHRDRAKLPHTVRQGAPLAQLVLARRPTYTERGSRLAPGMAEVGAKIWGVCVCMRVYVCACACVCGCVCACACTCAYACVCACATIFVPQCLLLKWSVINYSRGSLPAAGGLSLGRCSLSLFFSLSLTIFFSFSFSFSLSRVCTPDEPANYDFIG